jgi:hypothetical protein
MANPNLLRGGNHNLQRVVSNYLNWRAREFAKPILATSFEPDTQTCTVWMARAAASVKRRHQVPKVLDKRCRYETGQGGGRPSPPEQLVDVEDGDVVLDFTYRYLEAHSLPPTDSEVHNVTATIARYKGPRVVRWATLESFLAGLLTVRRA